MLEFSSTNNDCGCDSGSLNGFTDPLCPAPSVVTWQSLQGKPSCFTPCAHTHVPGDIIGLEAYIQSTVFANSIVNTNSIQLTAPSGVLNANLKLSSNAGTGYKVPLSILSDGLIGQIPYASGVSSGILSSTDWNIFNNKFNTPSGTTNQYVRGDGSLAAFPAGLPPSGVAGGELAGTYPNPSLLTTAVTGKLLSGLPLFSNTPITSADSILSAFSKIQGQINNIPLLPSFTVGSVLFGNGTGITQNNSKFFWDNTLFKLKLTDSKLELLNTSLLGSSTLEYKNFSSTAYTVLDQTDSTVHNVLKIRAYDGNTTGLLFGTVDGTDTVFRQVGMFWNTPNALAPNQLLINNYYNSTGIIKIQASAYTQVDGLAIKKSFVHTFNNSSSAIAVITYPYNVCRFNYGDSTAPTLTVRLPYNTFVPIPDGYIVIIKALNSRGSFSPVVVSVNPSSFQTLEAYTFTKDMDCIIYRYDATANNWDIISIYP